MTPLLTIDFEASCLPRDGLSFPIEVGIADLAGWSRSWLIRPAPEWAGWSWTDEAQALHGIDRALLEAEGRPAAEVMLELNAAIAGRQVIADHHLDRIWLNTLSRAAGIAAAFRVGHVAELLDALKPDAAVVRQAVAAADREVPVRHRARADALWLAAVARSLEADEEPERPLFPWGDQPERQDDMPPGAAARVMAG